MVSRSVCVSGILFSNTGSVYGFISSAVPHEAFCQVLFLVIDADTSFCSLGEVGGAGAEPPYNLPPAAVVQTVLPLEWSRRKRGQDFFILFPVFGGEMTTAKIQTVKGLRVEIFSRTLRKNTTRPLTVWIVGTDIKRGIAFRNWV